MGPFVRKLVDSIRRYRLDHNPRIERLRKFAEQGHMSEFQARAHLLRLEKDIQRSIDQPNFLHRPPTKEQLDADGPLDVPLGSLVEADLPFGLRMRDRPRHVLVAGSTGSGKTTAIRRIIEAIDRLDQ